MHEDVQQQLVEQATNLQKDIRSAEVNLNLLKESYLKVQGALELLNHLNASTGEATISGLLVTANEQTGLAKKVTRVILGGSLIN